MGVEVVQHQADGLGLRVKFVYQQLHGQGKVLGSTRFAHLYAPEAHLRFEKREQVGCAFALVLVVVAHRLARFGRQGSARLGHHLVLGHLIKADQRLVRIVALLVEIQNVLHAPDKLRAQLWDAPLLLQPRFYIPYLSVRRSVSSEIPSATTSSSTSLLASICILQRFLPSGGSEQAKAIR